MFGLRILYNDDSYMMENVFSTFEKAKDAAERQVRDWPSEKVEVVKFEPIAVVSVTITEPKYIFNWE